MIQPRRGHIEVRPPDMGIVPPALWLAVWLMNVKVDEVQSEMVALQGDCFVACSRSCVTSLLLRSYFSKE